MYRHKTRTEKGVEILCNKASQEKKSTKTNA
jgi:hypothetical protein